MNKPMTPQATLEATQEAPQLVSLTRPSTEKFVFLTGAAGLLHQGQADSIQRGHYRVSDWEKDENGSYTHGKELWLTEASTTYAKRCELAWALNSQQTGWSGNLDVQQEYAGVSGGKLAIRTREEIDENGKVRLTREYGIVVGEAEWARVETVCQLELSTVGAENKQYIISAQTCVVKWDPNLISNDRIHGRIVEQLQTMTYDIANIEFFAGEHSVGNGES